MDENFDEFGNLIGPEYSDSDENDLNDGSGSWQDTNSSDEDEKPQVHLYDTHDINTPLVNVERKQKQHFELPRNWEFRKSLLENPNLVRTVRICGPLNHGKTSLLRALGIDVYENEVEKNRDLTLHSRFYTSLLQTSEGKSYVFNFIDTAGHTNLMVPNHPSDLVEDGEVYIVDAVEGLTSSLPINPPQILVISKLDRLITELKLPPKIATAKLMNIVNESKIHPENVVFTSSELNFSFTLDSIQKLYTNYSEPLGIDLWDPQMFCEYVLTPIYKLISCALIGRTNGNGKMLESLGITVPNEVWTSDYKARIQYILGAYLVDPWSAFTDSIVNRLNVNSSAHGTLYIAINSNVYAVSRSTELAHYIPNGNQLFPLNPPQIACISCSKVNNSITPSETSIDPPLCTSLELIDDSTSNVQSAVEFLTKFNLVNPWFTFKLLENAEIEINTYGELAIDYILYTLRSQNYELRNSTPTTNFKETVNCSNENRFTAVSRFKTFEITVFATNAKPATCLVEHSTNTLKINDDVELDDADKQMIIEAFKWCCLGYLIEQPFKDVNFTITTVKTLKPGVKQVLPTARKAFLGSFLLASPRFMQPISLVKCVSILEAGKAIYKEISTRGGEIIEDEPIPGSNLYLIKAKVPTIDTLALELDIGCQMESPNHCSTEITFYEWKVVESNPFASVEINRGKISNSEEFGKDILVKTRFRKHLPNLDVSSILNSEQISTLNN